MGSEKTADLEFEARKEKKKLKEKKKKDGRDRKSSLIEVSEDKMGVVVKVQKSDRNGGGWVKKKKKRKRDIEGAESESKSNLTIEQERVNERTTDLEFEARKEKKKLKAKKKDGPDRKLSLVEVPEDKMGEVVQVQKSDTNNGEQVEKKKKRKREMEGAESESKSNLTIEQELVNECEKSNVKTTDSEFEARKEKKRLKEKKKKDEPDRKGVVVKVQKSDMSSEKEIMKKKKKRRRELEGFESESKSNLTIEQELVNACEKSNEKIMEEAEFADNRKKRKKSIKDDKMGEAGVEKKKKKKKEKREKVGGELVQNITDGKGDEVESEHSDGKIMEKGGIMKKEKRKRRKNSSEMQVTSVEKLGTGSSRSAENNFLENVGNARATREETSNRNIEDVNVEDGKSKDKRKAKSVKGILRTQNHVRVPDLSENSTSKKAAKRVSFSDEVVVFPLSDGPNDAEKGLIRGKRFSKEEDELLKQVVLTYIEEHKLGEEGIEKVLHCRLNPELKNCWKDIGAFLPSRPSKSIYYRAHMLFERAKERIWTPEEYEEVRRVAMKYKEKGEAAPNWKKVGYELGKHRIHVKDAWRRIKLPNMKKGQWSQDEYQVLFNLVNKDLQMRALEEKKSQHAAK